MLLFTILFLFIISFAGSVLFFITTFVMEPSSDDETTTTTNNQPAPRVMYDNGHDNKVFVGEGLSQPQFTQPQTNGSTNVYYPNGNGSAHTNGHAHRANDSNDEVQPTYRVIEDSRL